MYSPKIEPEQVKRLYLLKRAYASKGIKMPMTRIVRNALDEYLDKIGSEIESMGDEVFPE